jgi:hypothetical protein
MDATSPSVNPHCVTKYPKAPPYLSLIMRSVARIFSALQLKSASTTTDSAEGTLTAR